MAFADAVGRDRQSTKKDVLHGLDSPEPGCDAPGEFTAQENVSWVVLPRNRL